MAKSRNIIEGFSKLTRHEKLKILSDLVKDKSAFLKDMDSHLHKHTHYQKLYNEFSENTISNFYLPYGIAPNFLINDKLYFVPMVTDESSVVAAASAGAKYWASRGGFRSKVLSTLKTGQIHFTWRGDFEKLQVFFNNIKNDLITSAEHITKKMQNRGGGILGFELIDKSLEIPFYYQLHLKFDTRESMGANFINSILESIAMAFKEKFIGNDAFTAKEKNIDIVMAILSNYSPECVVETHVECPVDHLASGVPAMSSEQFANKFRLAIDMTNHDINRAVTHNKGIYNGVDAVALATGNDFRAIEAQGHAWASENGKYIALSEVKIQDGIFKFMLRIPLSVGTIGGLTTLHPMAKRSLEILGNPGANELMQIISSTGLANNFSALKSLITTGIQKGHMLMHLSNILRSLNASETEMKQASDYFMNKPVSNSNVEEYLQQLRNAK